MEIEKVEKQQQKDKIMKTKWIFNLQLILKYRNIIRMNLDLMVFILEIICLEKGMGRM